MPDAFRTIRPNTIFESIRDLAAADIEIGTVYFEIGVPTVFVVDRPQIVTPTLGRIYKARVRAENAHELEEAWWYDGRWVTYAFLRELTDFNGMGDFPQGYIAELWENRGDPGQTCYELCGYRFVALSNEAITHIQKKYVQRLEGRRFQIPPFMEPPWHKIFSRDRDDDSNYPLVWKDGF